MGKLNLNQKKLIAEAIINLSVAYISISTITPIIYKFEYDQDLLISIFIVIIISLVLSVLSIIILKK